MTNRRMKSTFFLRLLGRYVQKLKSGKGSLFISFLRGMLSGSRTFFCSPFVILIFVGWKLKGSRTRLHSPQLGCINGTKIIVNFTNRRDPGLFFRLPQTLFWTGIIGFVVAVFTWDDSWHDQVTLCSITYGTQR